VGSSHDTGENVVKQGIKHEPLQSTAGCYALCFIYMQGGYPTLLGRDKTFSFISANGFNVIRRLVHKGLLVGSSSSTTWRLCFVVLWTCGCVIVVGTWLLGSWTWSLAFGPQYFLARIESPRKAKRPKRTFVSSHIKYGSSPPLFLIKRMFNNKNQYFFS
jgi:hypothetical protein